jgi:hypothetical protein
LKFLTSTIKSLSIAVFVLATGAAQASIVVYTTQASYLAAIANPGVDTFDDLSGAGLIDMALPRTAGTFNYLAEAGPDSGLYGAGNGTDGYLSTDSPFDIALLSGFSSKVRGVGGFFFGSNVSGQFEPGATIELMAADNQGGYASYSVVNSDLSSFVGFVWTGELAFVMVWTDSDQSWLTIDDLTLGTAIPEPATYSLMLAGLGMMGVALHRRQRKGQ